MTTFGLNASDGVGDRVAGGGNGRVRIRGEQIRHGANQRGRQQRLVALDVDDDGIVGQAELPCGLGQTIRAGRMIGRGEAGRDAVRLDGGLDPRIVGRDDDARRAGRHRALGDAHHHRLAGDVRQRLAGKARRRVARGMMTVNKMDGSVARPPTARSDAHRSSGRSTRSDALAP